MADQENTANGGANGARDRIKEEFNALPLDKKLASLLDMEVAVFSDSISYVVNNSGEILNKVGEVISDFSCKVESEFKKATRANAAAAGAETHGAAETPSDAPGSHTKSDTKGKNKGKKESTADAGDQV